jgi:type IV pilus assembly protein PilA
MTSILRKRLERDEEGFTLIELMVVVLIIAILLAIAIPTFLGARSRAQDRAAQASLRNALTAEKTYYTDHQSYTDVAADMTAIEPALKYSAADSLAATQGTESLSTDSGNNTSAAVVCLTTQSASGTTFVIVDESTGAHPGTTYYKAAVTACNDTVAAAGAASF